jgi:hypothetical protein
MTESIAPTLVAQSFSCPHCGALAHQNWFKLLLSRFNRDEGPTVLSAPAVGRIREEDEDEIEQTSRLQFLERLRRNEVTFRVYRYSVSSQSEFVNAWVSHCYSCEGFAFWIKDRIVFPPMKAEIKPHEDIPATIRDDFQEAASIVELSPRSAAALLRLCIQKLMVELKQKGENLNDDIGALVAAGLETGVQKALDVVRVVGNNAVHPGQIDLKDDRDCPDSFSAC